MDSERVTLGSLNIIKFKLNKPFKYIFILKANLNWKRKKKCVHELEGFSVIAIQNNI